MTAVSTTQTPDLLLSLLMGMVGSADGTTPTADAGGAGSLFATLLEPAPKNGTQSAELPGGLSELLADEASQPTAPSQNFVISGSLSALIAASRENSIPSSRENASPASRDLTKTAARDSEEQSTLESSQNTYLLSSLVLPFNGFGQAVNGVSERPNISERPTHGASEPSISGDGALGTVGNRSAQKMQVKESPNSAEVLKDNDAVVEPTATERQIVTNGDPLSQLENSAGATETTHSDNHTESGDSRSLKNRSSKAGGRESSESDFTGSVLGGLEATGLASFVTALNYGGQAGLDTNLSREQFSETFGAQVASQDAGSESADLQNFSGAQVADLNGAQTEFEQTLEKVSESFPLDSVAQQIVEVAKPDSGWISVEIQPPELGKLEIMVSKQGEEYSARIVAHESSTEQALSLQQSELIEALNQHGLELKEIQIVSDVETGASWNSDSSGNGKQDDQTQSGFFNEKQAEQKSVLTNLDTPVAAMLSRQDSLGRQPLNFLV